MRAHESLENEAMLDEWVKAKRQKNYVEADRLRDELRAKARGDIPNPNPHPHPHPNPNPDQGRGAGQDAAGHLQDAAGQGRYRGGIGRYREI